ALSKKLLVCPTYLHLRASAKARSAPTEFLFHLAQKIEINYFRGRNFFLKLPARARKFHAEQDPFLVYLSVRTKRLAGQIVGRRGDFAFDSIPALNHVDRSAFVILNIPKAAQSRAQDSFDLLGIFFE